MAEDQKYSDYAAISSDMAVQEQAALGRRRPTSTPADDRMWQASIREDREAMAFERERMGYARELAQLREQKQQELAAMETQLAQAITLASNPYAPQIQPAALIAPEVPRGTPMGPGAMAGHVPQQVMQQAQGMAGLVAPRIPR